jgi:hypothetical protein
MADAEVALLEAQLAAVRRLADGCRNRRGGCAGLRGAARAAQQHTQVGDTGDSSTLTSAEN